MLLKVLVKVWKNLLLALAEVEKDTTDDDDDDNESLPPTNGENSNDVHP